MMRIFPKSLSPGGNRFRMSAACSPRSVLAVPGETPTPACWSGLPEVCQEPAGIAEALPDFAPACVAGAGALGDGP